MVVSRDTIEKAVDVLLKWKQSKERQYDFIYLNLSLNNIPPKSTNAYRIQFPHPLYDTSSSNLRLCLIIDDRPNSRITQSVAAKIIESQRIPNMKVISLSELKTSYQSYMEKRKLCNSYDVLFVDTRIAHLLHKILGKQFFKKKKLPLPLEVGSKNWKEQVETACGSGLFYLRSGPSCMMKVANVDMKIEQIVENVAEAIEGVVQVVPKKWGGVKSLHLRFLSDSSLEFPLFPEGLAIEGINDDVGGNAENAEDTEEEESSDEDIEEIKDEGVEKSKKRKADNAKASVLSELNGGEKKAKKMTSAEKKRQSKSSLKDGKKSKTSELGKKVKEGSSKAKNKRSKKTA